jgi:hypothetical protein
MNDAIYVDCPVCFGEGHWLGIRCGCCKGTGKMELTKDQYARRVRELAALPRGRGGDQRSTHNVWEGEELHIAVDSKSPTEALHKLQAKGYLRTIAAISNIRCKV